MNSRERVLAAFAHVEPDRVPRWCGASAEFWAKARETLDLDDEGLRLRLGDDFRRVTARYAGPLFPITSGSSGRTIFGVERGGMGYGQPLSHPLTQATLKEIDDYPWPDPAWQDVSRLADEAAAWHGSYAVLGGDWSPFWHDLIDLMGMESMGLAMYDRPEVVDAILDRVVSYYYAVNERIFAAAAHKIDIFFFGNDLGSQRGPLLSEGMYRRFLQPHMARLIDLAHGYGLKAMMHCCGGFSELIPAMIEIGLDGLQAIQPSCRGMALHWLKAEFGDRILLNGAIDSHHVLIDGTPPTVRAKTREVLQIMMPGGGYVAGASHDAILEETAVENVLAMFDAIEEFGRYGSTAAL